MEAEAVLESEGVYVAIEVEFETEDSEFGGRVASVDVEGGSFTLMNGRTYLVTEATVFDEEGDLGSLEAMAGAMEGGDVVTVEGLFERNEEGARVVVSMTVKKAGP